MSVQPPNPIYKFDATYFVESPCHEKVIQAFNQVCKKYIFQLEKSPTTGNLHYQCFFSLKVKCRPKHCGAMLSGLDLKGISVRPASNAGMVALSQYCMKPDSRIDGPWADKPLWKLEYKADDLQCIMKQPLPLQQYILTLLQGAPDDRCIYWFYDPIGCTGKSKLCKYLEYTDQGIEIPFGTSTQIKTSIISEGRHRCYFLDVPRTTGKDESLQDAFSTIEALKNGKVKSAMYGKVQKLFMEPPHVFVFSNHRPCKWLVSLDRWKVYQVLPKVETTFKWSPVTQLKDWTCAKCAKKRKKRNFT